MRFCLYWLFISDSDFFVGGFLKEVFDLCKFVDIVNKKIDVINRCIIYLEILLIIVIVNINIIIDIIRR